MAFKKSLVMEKNKIQPTLTECLGLIMSSYVLCVNGLPLILSTE